MGLDTLISNRSLLCTPYPVPRPLPIHASLETHRTFSWFLSLFSLSLFFFFFRSPTSYARLPILTCSCLSFSFRFAAFLWGGWGLRSFTGPVARRTRESITGRQRRRGRTGSPVRSWSTATSGEERSPGKRPSETCATR